MILAKIMARSLDNIVVYNTDDADEAGDHNKILTFTPEVYVACMEAEITESKIKEALKSGGVEEFMLLMKEHNIPCMGMMGFDCWKIELNHRAYYVL